MEGLISQGLITGMRGRYIAVLVKVTKTKRNNRFVWGQGWLIIGYICCLQADRPACLFNCLIFFHLPPHYQQ